MGPYLFSCQLEVVLMVTKPTYEELEQRVRELEKQSREREQAEEQIALFRRFTETSGQGLGMADLEGRITYANPTLCRLMGEERPEDPIGKPVQSYYAEQDLPRLENEILPTVFKKNQDTAEIPILSLKGELTPTIQNVFLIRNDQGEPVCLANVLTDITDRKKAEMELQRHHDHLEGLVAERTSNLRKTNEKLQREIAERKQAEGALRESEQRYRELVDLLPQTVFEIDKEGNVTFTNRCGFRSFGYCQEDLDKHLKALQMFIPDDRDRMAQNMREVLTSQEAGRNEYKALRKDGGTFPVITFSSPIVRDGQPVGLRGIVIDITELRQAEKKLRESEERLKLAMDAGDHGFWDWDLDTDEIYFSPRYYTMLGYEPGELPMVKDTWTRLMHPEDRETMVPRVQNYVENAERYEVEFRLKCKDGSWKWISGKGKSFELDENGRPWRAVGLHVDITERKQAEREKKKLESQLRQAQKMEAIGTLAGGIAHDFNNILAALIGYAEMAVDDVEEGSLLRANLREVLIAANRAKDLVKQILAFSRQAEQESRPVKVGLIVKEVLKLLRASLPTTIQIRQDIQSDSAVLADPTQIHQVLMNLCTNAGQAMEEKGGTLEVNLVDVEPEADFEVKHRGMKPGPYIKLTVNDTGQGMAPDMLDRIFDPYFSTKDTNEGTGLGLSVVHGIVKSCGGTVTANSKPGRGSTFDVFLPAIESEAEAETWPDEPAAKGTERILLIDDEEVVGNMGKQMLESLGYEVTTRTDGLEALELFKCHPDRFDLVITDMTMPKVTGEDLAAKLMEVRPDIPVILCTGFSAKINKQRAMALGIRAFVYKPVLRRQMATAIRQVLDSEEQTTEEPTARILLIDDDDQIRKMLSQLLEGAGYEVIGAADGKQGIRLFREAPCDVIITDIIMPEKEGIETIGELRRGFPDVKILAISGGGRLPADEYLRMAKSFGAHRTLAKPFEQKELLEALRELVG